MSGFYAIILDWHYDANGSALELIEAGSSLNTLIAEQDYDPAREVSRVVRSQFTTQQVKDHPIRNCRTNNINPAHICHLVAK